MNKETLDKTLKICDDNNIKSILEITDISTIEVALTHIRNTTTIDTDSYECLTEVINVTEKPILFYINFKEWSKILEIIKNSGCKNPTIIINKFNEDTNNIYNGKSINSIKKYLNGMYRAYSADYSQNGENRVIFITPRN